MRLANFKNRIPPDILYLIHSLGCLRLDGVDQVMPPIALGQATSRRFFARTANVTFHHLATRPYMFVHAVLSPHHP